jgi:hypothetical protein
LDTPRKIAAGQSNQSDGIFRSDDIQKKVDFIEAGDFHMLAIAEGILFSWGKNSQGQLGIGTFQNMTLPVKVGGKEKFGSDVRIASASQEHSLILTENRELWSFGNGDDGRLGLGTMSGLKIKNPRLVENHHFGTGRISVINAGQSHSAALTEDGKLYTWGSTGRGTGHYAWDRENGKCISALGHMFSKAEQPTQQQVPLQVQHRSMLTRSVAKQRPFGVFARLSEDHVVAFMMVILESNQSKQSKESKKNIQSARGPRTKQVREKDGAADTYSLHSLPSCVLRMIAEMARTYVLPNVYKELRGVRKLLGDPCV